MTLCEKRVLLRRTQITINGPGSAGWTRHVCMYPLTTPIREPNRKSPSLKQFCSIFDLSFLHVLEVLNSSNRFFGLVNRRLSTDKISPTSLFPYCLILDPSVCMALKG